MSSFGAVPIDLGRTRAVSLIASSNKGLEGVPGLGFVIAERAHLAASEGVASTLSLDLHAQWRGFEANGQWRFTPPVQVVAALDAALDALEAEGGVKARHARYRANRDVLVAGMRALGHRALLDDAVQAPVIVTFEAPAGFAFEPFYQGLAAQGFVIYPGKLAEAPSFRIGCIGQVFPDDMRRLVEAVRTLG
jgi:2-aminoethylphosphonate-pyruvate transaminase